MVNKRALTIVGLASLVGLGLAFSDDIKDYANEKLQPISYESTELPGYARINAQYMMNQTGYESQ